MPDTSRIPEPGTSARDIVPDVAAPDWAVVVLGHGSRNPAAQEVLIKVASLLALQTGWTVAHASLDFNRPNLPEAVAALYEMGRRNILVTPYLLYAGNHVARDIPAQLEDILAEHPDLHVRLTEPLGLDLRLVAVLESRVRAARGEEGAVGSDSVMVPADIERKSFEIIDGLLPDLPLTPQELRVATRVVHATGDPSLAPQMVFSPGAVERGIEALRGGAPVVCDVNMVRSGLEPSLRRIGAQAHCFVSAPETIEMAKAEGITRSVAAFRSAKSLLEGAVIAIGNAPTALLEVVRLSEEEGVRPALVVGMPVGFVAAAESKDALMASGLPHITLPGLRGGTPLAVAAVNALVRMSAPDPTVFAGSPAVVAAGERSEG
jgi:precorrin-8X/cobalt-precorrin-8 methylmutase